MIRKLTETDRTTTLNFLLDEPEINLFMIGDIERFGFEADFQVLWGDFDENHALQAVLLRYEVNYIPYFKNPDYDISVFANLILSDPKVRIISGKESLTMGFKEVIPSLKVKSTYFCKLTDPDHLEPLIPSDPVIHLAVPDDAGRILTLLNQIDEFKETLTSTEERLRQNIESGAARIYFVENEQGELLSVSQTTAENSRSAMIVGVATHSDYRGQGLMSKCLSRLCHDLLQEGKTLCLFYDNPKAGSVYHRLGFVSIDKWLMLVAE
jgi:hypothetical protein